MVPPPSNRGFFGKGRWALDLPKKINENGSVVWGMAIAFTLSGSK